MSCACVLPLWSAAIEPRVLPVRAIKFKNCASGSFDLRGLSARVLCGPSIQHVRVDLPGAVVRLDVIDGTLVDGPVTLIFELPDDFRLSSRLDALASFQAARCGAPHVAPLQEKLSRKLLSLHAADAEAVGASLRDIANALFGEDDWPGNGEHRKSRVRRLVAAGRTLIRAGPRAILA